MEEQDLKEIPMFFILGRPRSGTTLLSTLFDAHPSVKIPPEFPILLLLYQKFRKVKDWDEKAIESFVETIFNSPSFNNRNFGNLRIDRETYKKNLMNLKHKGTVTDFLKSFNYYSFSMFPKQTIKWIGDKNPVYSIYARRFLKIFPEAKFICIIRDYRDNYISMKGLSDLNLEAAVLPLQVSRWRYVVKLFLKFSRKYPDRFTIIRYEDLVQKQEEVFKSLCEFLKVEYDPSVFDFYQKKEESLTLVPGEILEKYHKSLMNPINTGRMDLWKTRLNEKEIRTADQIAGRYADLLCYERRFKRFNLWSWVKTRPAAVYCLIIFKIMEYGSYLPSKLSLKLNLNLLILVRVYNFFFPQKKEVTKT